MNQVNQVRQFLLQYNAKVSEEWLAACIDYVNTDPDLSGDLNKNVYYQFLHGNISEIGIPSLPAELFTRDNFIFQGSICLQVNSFQDISQPAYAQLQKIRGRELDDVEEPSADWKKKKETPRRMLKLELTDGENYVTAMEYSYIKCLDPEKMSPGCKIRICGPVMIKRGYGMPRTASCIMMLKPENVVMLGGAVDELIESKSFVKVLEHCLANTNGKQMVRINSNNASESSSNPKTSCNGNSVLNSAKVEKNLATARVPPFTPEKNVWPSNATGVGDSEASKSNYKPLQPIRQTIIPHCTAKGKNDNSRNLITGGPQTKKLCQTTIVDTDEDLDDAVLAAVALDDEISQNDNLEEDRHLSFEIDLGNAYEPWENAEKLENIHPADSNTPFCYLVQAIQDCKSTFVIKGIVMSTVGKLEFSNTNGFSLKVKVSDPTGSIEAKLSQELITEFMGITKNEARNLHQLATSNKDVTAGRRLNDHLTRLRHGLASVSGKMYVDRCEGADGVNFELKKYSEFSVRDCYDLAARVDQKWRVEA